MKFRKTITKDIEQIIKAEQAYCEFVGQWSFEQHKSALSDENTAHIIFYDELQSNIGYAILKGLANPNKNIELMRIVINQPNNGYGKKAIALLLDWCFDKLYVHRIWLDVRVHNTRAEKVYSDMGFTRDGILRECILRDGKYESLFLMSILEDEYRQKL